MVDVTCVIPYLHESQNGLKSLHRAIASVDEQVDQVIVAWDGRDDDVHTILNLPCDDVVQHGCPIPAGVCHMRNLGIHAAHNDLILTLDADDWMMPGAVARMVEAWQPGRFVYSGWVEVDEATQTAKTRHAIPVGKLREKGNGLATLLFHRDHWRSVGGYDKDFEIGCEDWAFVLTLMQHGIAPVRIHEAMFTYNKRAGGRAERLRMYLPAIAHLMRVKFGIEMELPDYARKPIRT